jgi:Probable Zinc-ribbon domain
MPVWGLKRLKFDSSHRSEQWIFGPKNDNLEPKDVAIQSSKLRWFNCGICPHEIQITPAQIHQGRWCKYCAHKELCKNLECEMCLENSFRSSSESKFWSKINPMDPRFVFKSSHKEYLFNCPCGHQFKASPHDITSGHWCPYCCEPPKLLCKDLKCTSCWAKSISSSPRAPQWLKTNLLTTREVFLNTVALYGWKCDNEDCEHEFQASPANITSKNSWCPYCSNPPKLLCEDFNCEPCFDKSFWSSKRVRNWMKCNPHPRYVFLNCHDEFSFKCDEGHEFQMSCAKVTTGRWCPLCYNKGEAIVHAFLLKHFKKVQHQFRPVWAVNAKGNRSKFDSTVHTDKIIWETDGPQHFGQLRNWGSASENQTKDALKMKQANENGYSVVRVMWEDVFYDKNDWDVKILVEVRETIILSGKVQNVFICLNNEYENHKYLVYENVIINNVLYYIDFD